MGRGKDDLVRHMLRKTPFPGRSSSLDPSRRSGTTQKQANNIPEVEFDRAQSSRENTSNTRAYLNACYLGLSYMLELELALRALIFRQFALISSVFFSSSPHIL
jgi:hypothetical protein